MMDDDVVPSGALEGKLASKVVEHWDREIDMIEALVYADSKQAGKSVYSLLTGYNVYSSILDDDVSPMKVWDMVFKWFYTDLEGMTKDLLHVAKNMKLGNVENKIPYVVFDDAGVGAGSGLYFKDRDKYFSLDEVLQVLGEIVQCFVMTATAVDSPTGMLTDDRNVTIKITKSGIYQRKAHIFGKDTLPWGKSRDKKAFEDDFKVLLPDAIYERYDVDRLDLTIDCLEDAVMAFDPDYDPMDTKNKEIEVSF